MYCVISLFVIYFIYFRAIYFQYNVRIAETYHKAMVLLLRQFLEEGLIQDLTRVVHMPMHVITNNKSVVSGIDCSDDRVALAVINFRD